MMTVLLGCDSVATVLQGCDSITVLLGCDSVATVLLGCDSVVTVLQGCDSMTVLQGCDSGCSLQGAPEGLLDRCTHVRIGHNKVPMSPAIKNEIMKLTKIYGTGRPLTPNTQPPLLCIKHWFCSPLFPSL